MCGRLGVSERRATRILGQRRTAKLYVPGGKASEGRLIDDVLKLARNFGRYSTSLAFFEVAVGQRQACGVSMETREVTSPEETAKRDRLWLTYGSRIRLRSNYGCNA